MVRLRLRQILKAKSLSQLELAQRLGVSKITVNAWATGRSYPSIETLDRIALLLDTPISHFFDEPPPSANLDRISRLAADIQSACHTQFNE